MQQKLVKGAFKQAVVNLGQNFRGYNNYQDVLKDFYNHLTSINASPWFMCSYCGNNAVGLMVRVCGWKRKLVLLSLEFMSTEAIFCLFLHEAPCF